MKLIVDLEANGFLDTATTIWVMVAKDCETGEKFTFSDYSKQDYVKPLCDGLSLISNADAIVGHNIIIYDTLILDKLCPNCDLSKPRLIDTLILSQLSHFSRPLRYTWGRHSLEAFGKHFGRYKPEQAQWTEFEEAMVHRCEEDVEINYLTYRYLQREVISNGMPKDVADRELETASISRQQVKNGWRLDIDKAKEHLATLDTLIADLARDIEPKLPMTIKKPSKAMTWEEVNNKLSGVFLRVPQTQKDIRGNIIKPAKEPTVLKFVKSGAYTSHIAKWFELDPKDGQKKDKFIVGPYTRVKFEISTMSQHAQVKKFLFTQGWRPTTWNYKKDASGNFLKDSVGRRIKTTPKLTEDSYESIKGELGKAVAKHNTYVSRRKAIENPDKDDLGWLNNLAPGDRVICTPRTIGAATARMTHAGVVNVPGSKAVFGKEMRELFIATYGYKIVACDMASAQLRLFAAAMGDPKYIEAVTAGSEHDEEGNYIGTDIHSVNGIAAGLIDPEWPRGSGVWEEGQEVGNKKWTDGRAKAKTFIYALLFGAGDAKLGTIVGGGLQEGRELRSSFLKKLPAIERLISKLKKEWDNNKHAGEGWFKGLDGRRIYCNSPHKILNYKLQSDEAILLKQWLINVNNAIAQSDEVNHSRLLLSYHDELNYETIPEETDALGVILKQGIQEAGNQFGIGIMDGDYKVGNNWASVH
jgi:hypothetical protein